MVKASQCIATHRAAAAIDTAIAKREPQAGPVAPFLSVDANVPSSDVLVGDVATARAAMAAIANSYT